MPNQTSEYIKLIECPRDAMQGWKNFIPTQQKAAYINSLLKVGFDTIDFGSFVSPKAIPQMADTKEVIELLDMQQTSSKLLSIVVNLRGAQDAVQYDQISYIGYPFSISPTFQQRNANSTIEQSYEMVKAIQDLCIANNKKLVVYLSMGFGNPYGDEYNTEIVFDWMDKLISFLCVETVSVADTVGLATPEQINSLLTSVIKTYNTTEIGVHLHATNDGWKAKIDTALQAGCKRFDGAIKGIGGCPMANDELVGNMNTENMLHYFHSLNLVNGINFDALEASSRLASQIFI